MLHDEIIMWTTFELLWAVTWSPTPWKAPLGWAGEVSSSSEWEDDVNISAVAGDFTTLWHWLCSMFRLSITWGLWYNTFTSLAEIKSLSSLISIRRNISSLAHSSSHWTRKRNYWGKIFGVYYVVVWTWLITVFLLVFRICHLKNCRILRRFIISSLEKFPVIVSL